MPREVVGGDFQTEEAAISHLPLVVEASPCQPGGGSWADRLAVDEGDGGLGDIFVRGRSIELQVLVLVLQEKRNRFKTEGMLHQD